MGEAEDAGSFLGPKVWEPRSKGVDKEESER